MNLGKFDAEGFAFAKEALEAAGIEYVVRNDSQGSVYSPALGRAVTAPTMHDIFVDEERHGDAKVAVERWQSDAEEAALRESGAPPPDADEIAKDAEWERQKASDGAKRSAPVWPGLMLIVAVGGVLAWIFAGR